MTQVQNAETSDKLPAVSAPVFEKTVGRVVKLCAPQGGWHTKPPLPGGPATGSEVSPGELSCPSTGMATRSLHTLPALRLPHHPHRPQGRRPGRRARHTTPARDQGHSHSHSHSQELAAGGTVHGVVFNGLRHDTGDEADYLRTVVRPACCDRDHLGPEFATQLKEFVAGPAGQHGLRPTAPTTHCLTERREPGNDTHPGPRQPDSPQPWTGRPNNRHLTRCTDNSLPHGTPKAREPHTPRARQPHSPQPWGRSVQTTVISPVTAPSARRISISTGNSGRAPASSSATTSAAGRPRVAVAVTTPIASFR